MANMSIEELIEEIEVYVDNCKTAGVLSSGSMIKICLLYTSDAADD